MAISEKEAREPVWQFPVNYGDHQLPSPTISQPGSPPPAFTHHDSVGFAIPPPIPPQPLIYHPQHQMAQVPQQSAFNPQVDYAQYPSQQSGYGQPAPMPHQLARQTTGSQSQYQTVVAIPNLGVAPAPVECPICAARAVTKTTHHSGNVTHVWAAIIFCFTGWLCFVPYMMNRCKDVQHRCGNCGVLLSTWHRSGAVEVHV